MTGSWQLKHLTHKQSPPEVREDMKTGYWGCCLNFVQHEVWNWADRVNLCSVELLDYDRLANYATHVFHLKKKKRCSLNRTCCNLYIEFVDKHLTSISICSKRLKEAHLWSCEKKLYNWQVHNLQDYPQFNFSSYVFRNFWVFWLAWA